MAVKIDAYHGTDDNSTNSIIKNGFNPSIGNDQWIGDGTYFFIKGLSAKPELQAEKWAILSAWDSQRKVNIYDTFAVLHCIVEVEEDNLLDLNTSDGVDFLNFIQEQCMDKLKNLKEKKDIKYLDGYLINYARGENILSIEVCIANVYIKLEKDERIHHLSRRTSNCTICAVSESSLNRNIRDTNKIKSGGF